LPDDSCPKKTCLGIRSSSMRTTCQTQRSCAASKKASMPLTPQRRSTVGLGLSVVVRGDIQTDGRTLERLIDSAPHTRRTESIKRPRFLAGEAWAQKQNCYAMEQLIPKQAGKITEVCCDSLLSAHSETQSHQLNSRRFPGVANTPSTTNIQVQYCSCDR